MNKLATIRGHLLAVEGGDGSGKTDQVERLWARLTDGGYQVKVWDFPQYKLDSYGAVLVGRMLAGRYGPLMEIAPALAALPYVFDRLSVKDEMIRFMREGGVALCNRYADSNLAHGSAKCASEGEAVAFIEEYERFEYREIGLPTPSVSFYLATDAELSRKMVLKKSGREYLGGVIMTDEAEKNLEHQMKAREMYEYLCGTRARFARIECMIAPGQIETREVIAEKVWAELNRRFVV